MQADAWGDLQELASWEVPEVFLIQHTWESMYNIPPAYLTAVLQMKNPD